MASTGSLLLADVDKSGEFDLLRPYLGDLLAEDLLFLDKEDFVEQLGAVEPDIKPVLRFFFMTVTSGLPTAYQPAPADRVFSSDGDVQVIDFSSAFEPDSPKGRESGRSIYLLAEALEKLHRAGHIQRGKKTCLNLSSCHLRDRDVDDIAAGATKLLQLAACPQLYIILRLTRLSHSAKLGALLSLPFVTWLDVSATPFATVGNQKALAALKDRDVKRLILVSNPDVLHNALPALFEGDAQRESLSSLAHESYYRDFDPILPEREWVYHRHNAAQKRLAKACARSISWKREQARTQQATRRAPALIQAEWRGATKAIVAIAALAAAFSLGRATAAKA